MLNPFFALLRKDTNEDQGEVYGVNLVYSGNFEGAIEVESKRYNSCSNGAWIF